MAPSEYFKLPIAEQLAWLREWEDDWDGQGAVRPNVASLAQAAHHLENLAREECPPPARVYALSTGEVVAEWDNGPVHFEIEFAGSEKLAWMSSGPDRQSVHGSTWDESAAFELIAILAPSVQRYCKSVTEARVRRELSTARSPIDPSDASRIQGQTENSIRVVEFA